MAGRRNLPNQKSSAVRSRLAAPLTDTTTIEAAVAANTSDISDLDTRVTTNEGDITALDTRVTDNEADITTLTGLVGGAHYTSSDFNTDFATKTTANLTEGTNLYYTSARANAAINGRVNKTFVDALNVNSDTLDGYHASSFPRLATANTFTGALTTSLSGAATHWTLERTTTSPTTMTVSNSGNYIYTDYNGSGYKWQTGGVDRATLFNTGSLTLTGDISAANIDEAGTNNTIPIRSSAGDIYSRLFRSTYADQTTISGALAYRVDTSNNYIRFCSDTDAIKTWLGAPSLVGAQTFSGGANFFSGGDVRFTTGFVLVYDHTTLRLGSGSDYRMWHNGSHTYFDNYTGNLYMRDGTTTRWTFERTTGNFTASGNVTAYSDERLKSDIETLDGSKVFDMRGVSFTKDGVKGSGVIAQEMQKVAPELVQENEEYLSVAYGNTVGYLIEAVKLLKAEIEELKKNQK